MDVAIRQQLNAINQRFYQITADAFDETRSSAWRGWEPLPAQLTPAPHSVLDVGCGNGRFGVFLAEHLPTSFEYVGIDNSAELLAHARAAFPQGTFRTHDLLDPLAEGRTYDLVVLFGVMHHVAGAAQRQALMQSLAQHVAAGGWLVWASWRFYEFERFQRRLIPWEASPYAALAPHLEAHDYLLDWRRGETALRYCHYVDDAEQDALCAASGLTEVLRYRADGFSNTVNCYSVLERR